MKRLAIIGSVRKHERYTRDLFMAMYRFMDTAIGTNEVYLVSGGAAWADHLAVLLFLDARAKGLTIYMPCGWQLGFRANPTVKNDPARAMEYHHRQFASRVGYGPTATMQHLCTAQGMGAKIVAGTGFYQRNLLVGQVDSLVAFSWDDGPEPVSGGTAHTWRHSTAKHKHHVPLRQLAAQGATL